jgi:hypothetical protein
MLTLVVSIGLMLGIAGIVWQARLSLREEDKRTRRAEWRWAQRYYALRDALDRDESEV